MRVLGYILIAAGFLGGALAATLDAEGVEWKMYAICLGVGVAGIVIERIGSWRRAAAEAAAGDVAAVLSSRLERIFGRLDGVIEWAKAVHPCEVRGRLDAEVAEEMSGFVADAQILARTRGLDAYAGLMGPFAAAERYLARVWSASADGYVDEMHAYLAKTVEQLTVAGEVLKGLNRGTIVEP